MLYPTAFKQWAEVICMHVYGKQESPKKIYIEDGKYKAEFDDFDLTIPVDKFNKGIEEFGRD